MYLAQVCRYDILYTVNHLARSMSKPSEAHMRAAKHLLRYLTGSTDFSITYKQGGFKLTAFSDANWGANPDSEKSISNIIILSNGPISFKVGIQGLTAQPTLEAKLVAAAFTMKEANFCSNMMLELCFKERFDSVPLYIYDTLALHVAGNRTYSPRAKHIALTYFFVQELVEEGKITTHFVKTQDQIADLGTKHVNNHRHCALIKLLRNSRRKRQGGSVRRGRTRLYARLEYFSILIIRVGVFFSFSWTWHLHQRTVHHSTFLFSRINSLVIFTGIFLLFKFSVWIARSCMRFALRGSVNL